MRSTPIFSALFLLFISGTVFSRTFYLSPSGTDRIDCRGGTREDPWRTWRSLRDNGCISPGDTVFLMEGSYHSGSDFFEDSDKDAIHFAGAEGKPVVIAADPLARGDWPAKLIGEVQIYGDHGKLIGLEVYGNGEQPLAIRASNITVRDCYVHGRPEDIHVEGNQILGYDCIKILSGRDEQYHDIFILDNEICDCAEDGIDVTGARDLVYRGNHIHNARFIQVKGGTENILIENNHIHTLSTGIVAYKMGCSRYCGSPVIPLLPVEQRFTARNVVIRNNLIYDLHISYAIGANGWEDARIYNNTFYNTGSAPVLHMGRTGFWFRDSIALEYCKTRPCESCGEYEDCAYIRFPPRNIAFRNNIVHSEAEYVIEAVEDAVTEFSAGGNVYSNPAGKVAFLHGNTAYSLEDFPFESQSRIADPGFQDPSKGNFKLKPASPAIDAGVYFGPSVDYRGVVRDSRPDAGAYERE